MKHIKEMTADELAEEGFFGFTTCEFREVKLSVYDELMHRAKLYESKDDIVMELQHIRNLLCQTAWCSNDEAVRISACINDRIQELKKVEK